MLGRLLALMETQSLPEASKVVTEEVKAVWLHHFGPKLISGKEYGKEKEDSSNLKLKMIKSDENVVVKVKELHKKWNNLEKESRRPDRAGTDKFLANKEELLLIYGTPFDIRRLDAEEIIQHSGMLDWREEQEYLRSQMTREQVGCPGFWDTRQKKRDERRLKEEMGRENKEKKAKEAVEEFKERKGENDESDVEYDENKNDPDYEVKE